LHLVGILFPHNTAHLGILYKEEEERKKERKKGLCEDYICLLMFVI